MSTRFLLVTFEIEEENCALSEDELVTRGEQIASEITEPGPYFFAGAHVVTRADQDANRYWQ